MFLFGFLTAVALYFALGLATTVWMFLKFKYQFTPVLNNKAKIWNLIWYCTLTWPYHVLEFWNL